MSPLEENGYIGKQIQEWITQYRQEYAKWFTLAEDLNRFAHRQMLALEVNSGDISAILIAAAFLRSLSAFQGVIILVERGMVYEAATLARSQIESMFVLCASVDDPEFAKQYIMSHEANKLDAMKKLLQSSDNIRQVISNSITWDDVEKLKAKLKSEGVSDLKIADVAKKTKLYDWYTVNYAFISMYATHPTAASLDQYCEPDSEGKVGCFVWGPKARGIDRILSIAIEALIVILKHLSLHFGRDWHSELERFHKRFRDLADGLTDFTISHVRT
jgi:hypothetical protein